jgi:low affinity Fe/Cu permease
MEAQQKSNVSALFGRLATQSARFVGSPIAFAGAVVSILTWAMLGPAYRFSDTWQLVINTGTTIVTFLIVFVIQNTQNRDARAIHLKLDEIIHSIHAAHNEMINIETLSDEQLEQIAARYERIRLRGDDRRRKSSPGRRDSKEAQE